MAVKTVKTLEQMEQEWREYVSKKRGKTLKARRRIPKTIILSRHVTTKTGGKAVWGDFRQWVQSTNPVTNIRAAIRYAKSYLQERHIGTVVYVTIRGTDNVVPVWQAKWGHDNQPFITWNANPAADYWRRQIAKA